MAILIRRVILKNYKSIAGCKVDLRGVSLLVGPNGAGKSNFIDALRLVSDALDTTLEYAIRNRGGINNVRRRSGGHPTHFAVALRLDLGDGRNGHYAFRVGAKPEGAFSVQREQATISRGVLRDAFFVVEDGNLIDASDDLKAAPPKVSSDRLYLTSVSGVEPFRRLFDALSGMRFYSINPDPIRELQPHDSGQRLDRSGSNLAAVIKHLAGDRLDRIQEYLRHIVPGIVRVDYKAYGPRETLAFGQRLEGQTNPWTFDAANMSDGTLRSLGILAALFHPKGTAGGAFPFIALEEPESTIHPGAASVLMDAIFEAARTAQVLATTHSPDLLDHPDIGSDAILAVRSVGGETRISPVDEAARRSIKDALYTPGELLRAGQLTPEPDTQPRKLADADLFGEDR